MTEGLGRATWRTDASYSPCPRDEAGRYLAFLASLGYQLASIEQAVANDTSYPGDNPEDRLAPKAATRLPARPARMMLLQGRAGRDRPTRRGRGWACHNRRPGRPCGPRRLTRRGRQRNCWRPSPMGHQFAGGIASAVIHHQPLTGWVRRDLPASQNLKGGSIASRTSGWRRTGRLQSMMSKSC